MPSSTSSSEAIAADDVVERPLPQRPLARVALLGFAITLVLLAGWEAYWRSHGVEPSYRNSEGLWAMQRRRIDHGEGDGTVIVGSSRMLFNVQLDVWERESGQRPIQLSLEGTSPMEAMEMLADDEDFTGRLLVGVTPGLFFSGFAYRAPAFERYRSETPTQWLGQRISMLVEPWLAFYGPDFALFTVLERQPWPARDGVHTRMDVRKLFNMEKDRNTRLWDKIVDDVEYRELAKKIWAQGFVPISERDEEWLTRAEENRVRQMDRALAAVEKLHARGIEVIFVRCPAEGHYTTSDAMYHPRENHWDELIDRSGARGYHFLDHEEMQGYYLPEWSHMTGEDADRFTAALYQLINTAGSADQSQTTR